ncbi:MAG: endonuclease/exonuclease/phosphatase family protein [Thermodesulfobacteriota bacterium]|nr:endonuclease/exonuclease/phosphatase family protein [Thermodesulfobacteriota bacterium]
MPNTQQDPKFSYFSVMTLNVRFGLADSGIFSWENRKPAFEELFQAYRPDFIAMQENNDFQVDFFSTLLTDYQYIGRRSPAPRRWQHLLIFYKHPWECRKYDRFFLSPTPHVPSRMADSKWPRQCVIGIFRKNGCRVMCVNTHFDFDTHVQEKSAGILLDQLAVHSENSLPQLIMGDFNAAPGSPCHRVFTEPGHYLATPFTDTFSDDVTGTFHDFTGEPLSERVDWVLCRNHLRIIEKEIITRRFGNIFPSDHFPVYVRFACDL